MPILEETPYAIRFGAGHGGQFSVRRGQPNVGQTVGHFEGEWPRCGDGRLDLAVGVVFEEDEAPKTVKWCRPDRPRPRRLVQGSRRQRLRPARSAGSRSELIQSGGLTVDGCSVSGRRPGICRPRPGACSQLAASRPALASAPEAPAGGRGQRPATDVRVSAAGQPWFSRPSWPFFGLVAVGAPLGSPTGPLTTGGSFGGDDPGSAGESDRSRWPESVRVRLPAWRRDPDGSLRWPTRAPPRSPSPAFIPATRQSIRSWRGTAAARRARRRTGWPCIPTDGPSWASEPRSDPFEIRPQLGGRRELRR